MPTCPRCGAGPVSGHFCGNCGAPLQPPPYLSAAQTGTNWRTIGLATGCAVLLGVIGWGFYQELGGLTLSGTSAPAASGTSAESAPATKAKPGWVMGTVTDARGAQLKLDRSQVVIQVTGDLNNGQIYKGGQQLDGNGRYGVQVPPGKYTASGFVKVNFEGKEFWLSLDPVGGRTLQDSAQGVVKDLQWRLSGLKPDSDQANPYSYYGSYVFMLYQGTTLPDSAKVTFTASPLTPLADGSQGKALTFQATAQELKKGKNLVDLPLARYRITGDVTMPDGSRKKALISDAAGPAKLAQEFTFSPNAMGEGMEGVSLWMMGEQ